jgi:hypothetical protein
MKDIVEGIDAEKLEFAGQDVAWVLLLWLCSIGEADPSRVTGWCAQRPRSKVQDDLFDQGRLAAPPGLISALKSHDLAAPFVLFADTWSLSKPHG